MHALLSVSHDAGAHAQRLWLAGNARQRPGVIGAARCARLEPLGDCIRFVMDLGGGAEEPDLDARAMVAAAARLDLVSNVFRGGVHGSLVMVPIDVRAPRPCSWTAAALKLLHANV